MKIIPVIDILDGNVVHGIAGNRQSYQPIKSCLSDSSDPERIVQGFLDVYPFDQIYIADLNAFEGDADSASIVTRLAQHFPSVEFLVDAGFDTPNRLDAYADNCHFVPILATEVFSTAGEYLRLRKALNNKPYILSLDHNKGRLGASNIFDETVYWPEKIIVMSLDDVGSNGGPNLELISAYQRAHPEHRYIAAGGVRNLNDVNILAAQNVYAALIASALHAGQITDKDLKTLAQKNAPL